MEQVIATIVREGDHFFLRISKNGFIYTDGKVGPYRMAKQEFYWNTSKGETSDVAKKEARDFAIKYGFVVSGE